MTAAGAAASLARRREPLAREVTEALYREMPHLQEKYGDRGREKCLQDIHHNLEHLQAAVELEDEETFADYVRWLRKLLLAWNVSMDEVERSLELMEASIATALPPEELAYVLPVLRRGLSTFGEAA